MEPTLIMLLLYVLQGSGNFQIILSRSGGMLGKGRMFLVDLSPGSFHPNLFGAESCHEHWGHRGTNPGPSLQEK